MKMLKSVICLVVLLLCFNGRDCIRITAFEGTPVNPTCPAYQRILVVQAIYADLLVGTATCSDPNTRATVATLCEQKQSCSFVPNSSTFTSTCNEAATRHRFLLDYNCFQDLCLTYSTFCDNGGSCTLNTVGAPYCKCRTGYGGYNCEFGGDPCLQSTSPNCGNGQCITNALNQAECNCTGDWTGTNCDASPCTANTCLNDGTCIVTSDGKAVCLCKGDWSGKDCSVSPCSTNLCLNNGTCNVDASGKANCTCEGDYTGCYCSVNACSFVTCQNGGTCRQNSLGLAECVCSASFQGSFCETNCSAIEICPANFQELPAGSGNCFFICTTDSQSQLSAEATCRGLGATLWGPSYSSGPEVTAITGVLLSSKKYWTGGYDGLIEGSPVYLGSGQDVGLGSTVDGTNTDEKDCIEIFKQSGTWKFGYITCTVTTRRCICQQLGPCDDTAVKFPGLA